MENITTTSITASEAERTKTEIHALLNQYPELGMNPGYVAALGGSPAVSLSGPGKPTPSPLGRC